MRHIDLETRSGADISKTGSYKYLQDPDFRILLFGYKIDDDPVEVIDLTEDEKLPDEIVTILQNPLYIKHAYNAAFEWYALNRAGYRTPIEQWQCTMVHALYCGYPAGLANTGEAVGLEKDKKKQTTGAALIRYFCVPQKPTKNFKGKYHEPADDPDRWELFKDYNRQDVVAENAILQRLQMFPMPEDEWRLWRMDIRMNALGVRVGTDLIEGALRIDDISRGELTEEARRITGLENPNSTQQLLSWLQAQGCPVDNLQKLTIEEALQRDDLTPAVRRVLQLRQLLGKTSIKKYQAMAASKGEDDRIRGISQFYGANRTGRYAGRLVQLQNLPRNGLDTLDDARRMVRRGDHDAVRMIYGNVPDALSQLIRTAFIPSEGRHFVMADFSAIEARVIAWLAGEDWVLDVFRKDQDLYCETASQMFGVPVEKHGVNSDLRQKGKIATLALGYQGSVNAMVAMGALRMGVPEEDLPDIVDKWRQSHPKTVQLWYAVERAALECVSQCADRRLPAGPGGSITFRMEQDLVFGQSFMTIELPTGRKLYYPKPYIKENQFGKPAVHYYGASQTTGKWGELSTYGGKLVENCLAGDTLVITDRGFIPLKDVNGQMRLWDGLEWVQHSGLAFLGLKETIKVDGVRVTPEHKIFTAKGWKRADESKGFDRENIQWEYRAFTGGLRRSSFNLESEMRVLWGAFYPEFFRNQEGETKIMRLHEKRFNRAGEQNARDVRGTDLERLAFHEGALRDTNGAGVEELRGPGHTGMQEMVGELRGIPGRHGTVLPEGADARPDRRERGLLPGELQMGDAERTGPEQTGKQIYKHAEGADDCSGGLGNEWNRGDYDPIQAGSRSRGRFAVDETGREEPVYDIKNAGPRHCYYVISDHGPMKVHNCVQAIARDCLCEVLKRIDAKGWDVVFHVHDEVIVDAPLDIHTDDLCALMAEPVSWAPGLPLKGAGFEAGYYMKD